MENKPEETPKKKNYNLVILGVISIAIAVLTTSVSVILYHRSGDIYLDRSRPGFLPDESEVDRTPPTTTYRFSDNGPIDSTVYDEYIENFEKALDQIDDLDSPFSETPLTDESLGI